MRYLLIEATRECSRYQHCRLIDVEHSDHRLYLIFEWLDKDLKNYMDSVPGGMSEELVKVC